MGILLETRINKSETLIEGCGLLLLSPYLTQLFNACDLLKENKFKNEQARFRGIALLHYIIYGTETHALEEELIVPSMLCDVVSANQVFSLPKLNQHERSLADSMLQEIGLRCSRLKNATTKVIRENFIQRYGKLSIDKQTLNIEIKKRTYDVLLEDLPNASRVSDLPWISREVILNWAHF